MFKNFIREPLLHFLLIGAALFMLYAVQNDQTSDDDSRITISNADIARLSSLWEKKWQRPPTQSELEGMVEAQIREEVFYREALVMGLEQNDSVVRRRLAQKVEFIFSDLTSQVEPTDTKLTDYLAAHPDKFEIPARISFMQIYLNADRRGEQVASDANRLQDELNNADIEIDISTAGDAFMFGQQHQDLTRHQVARLFGKQFTDRIFDLPMGSWQKPIASGYGLHLVRVDKKIAATTPALDEVRSQILNEWRTQQRKTLNEQFYQKLRARYEIVIEGATVEKNVAGTAFSNRNPGKQ